MTQDHTLKSEKEVQVEETLPENGDKTEADAETTTEVIEGEIVAEELEEEELPEPEEEEEIDELTALSQQLEATQAQADEYLDDLRRERAAFQNLRNARRMNGPSYGKWPRPTCCCRYCPSSTIWNGH